MYTQTLSHSLSSTALEQLHKSLTLILVTENIKRIPFQQKKVMNNFKWREYYVS